MKTQAHAPTDRPHPSGRSGALRLRPLGSAGIVESTGPLSRRAWRCYGRHGGVHLLIFLIVFNGASLLAERDGSSLALYMAWETAIPFVPAWIWVYASMAVVIVLPPLFLGESALRMLGMQCLVTLLFAASAFLALPGELGFIREIPAEEPYRTMFGTLFAYDRGNNLVPSLHVGICSVCLLAFADAASPAVRVALLAWLGAIMASTVLVHQHHLLDVAAGLALAVGIRRCAPL